MILNKYKELTVVILMFMLALPLYWSWGLSPSADGNAALPLTLAQCEALSKASIKGAWTNIRFSDAGLFYTDTYKAHMVIIWDVWQWFEALVHSYAAAPQSFNAVSAAQEFCDLVNKVHTSYFDTFSSDLRIKRGYHALYIYLIHGIKILSPEVYELIAVHVHATNALKLIVI